MTDIVERLRGLRFVHVPVASGLMEEAAAEIERLRNGATDGRETVQSDRPSGVSDASAAAANQQLRERGHYGASPRSTNHDAVPDARARTDADSERTDKAAPRPGEGTGNTHAPVAQSAEQRFCEPLGAGSTPAGGFEPEAWGVLRVGGSWVSILANEVQAETSRHAWDKSENWVHEIVPLYRHPTLTDEEREAILAMACYCDTRASLQHQKWASTFRIMLEVRK